MISRRGFYVRISALNNPPLSSSGGENWSKRMTLTRMGKLRSGLSSNIIIDTALAAERIRNFNEKELESADVERIKRTGSFLLPPAWYFHSRRIFSRQIDCAAVYPTSTGFCRFAAIPDANDARWTDAGCVSTLWMLSMRAIDANPMNLDFYVCTERGKSERESTFRGSPRNTFVWSWNIAKSAFEKRIPI